MTAHTVETCRANALLAGICAEVKELLPGLRACEPHDGIFDRGEIVRWGRRSPAAFASWMGAESIVVAAAGGQAYADQRLALSVLTTDAPGLPRGAAARRIVECLLLHIPRARWGMRGVGAAEDIRAENRYAAAVDKRGVAFWTIGWRQRLKLGAASGEAFAIPARLYVGPPDSEAEAVDREVVGLAGEGGGPEGFEELK